MLCLRLQAGVKGDIYNYGKKSKLACVGLVVQLQSQSLRQITGKHIACANGHGSAQILKNKTTDESFYHLLLPPPGDLPNPGVKPISPALVGRFLTTESPGKAI